MTAVFVDTYYYLALLNKNDVQHERVALTSRTLRVSQLTTDWILMELADALCAPFSRQNVVRFWKSLLKSANVTVLPPEKKLLDKAFTLYAERPDKDWSLTDCTSFVVMQRMGLKDALTADRHFVQAGFNALLI